MIRLTATRSATRAIARAIAAKSGAPQFSTLDILQTIVTNPLTITAATTTAATAYYAMTNYKIGRPGEYIVKTGLGIKDMTVDRQTMRWPFQEFQKVEVNPSTYSFQLHCMSKGKVEFELPVVFTIGPILPSEDPVAFRRYCQLMIAMQHGELERTIKGIIEGETRGLTAQLDVEEMFNGKEKFRAEVVEKLAVDLEQFGLKIYNANIQEMRDRDENNKYFEYRKKRAIEPANNEARADVAEAQMGGDIAVSEREKTTRITLADNAREAVIRESQAQIEILKMKSQLAVQEAATKQATETSNVEAEQNVAMRRQELQAAVEKRRHEQMIQAMNADILPRASAEAEAKKLLADAAFYAQSKEAEGKLRLMEAQAEGVRKLFQACADDPELAKFYIGAESGLWREMTQATAQGVNGMKPQITIVGSNGQEAALSDTVMKTMYGLAPLLGDVYAKMGSAKGALVGVEDAKK